MSSTTISCPICQAQEASNRGNVRAMAHIFCPRCGEFSITQPAMQKLKLPSISIRQRSVMSSAIREKGKEYGIDENVLDQFLSRKDKAPLDKLDLLLLYIYKTAEKTNSPFAGQKFELERNSVRSALDPTLISQDGYAMQAACWAMDTQELIAMFTHLREQEYLHPDTRWSNARLTTKGFERVAALQRDKGEGKQAFVAMWFHKKMELLYNEAIEPAIKDAGYIAKRIDRAEHANKIDDEIIMEIRRSRFVVADFTGQRGGVYYEAGFALGLGIPVIWTCQEGAQKELHFDTRQYNHLLWNPEALKPFREALHKRIGAIIGPGPA